MADKINTLNDFYQELSTVGLRLQHQFQVLFFPPTSVNWPQSLNNVSFYAEGANIPGRAQNKQDIMYLGFPLKIPTTMSIDETSTMTMRCDAGVAGTGSILRNALMDWSNYHSNMQKTTGLPDVLSTTGGVKRIPTASIDLVLLSEDLKTAMETYRLYGAFPTTIAQMTMSNAAADAATFETTFTYQYFTINPS